MARLDIRPIGILDNGKAMVEVRIPFAIAGRSGVAIQEVEVEDLVHQAAILSGKMRAVASARKALRNE